MSTVNFNDSTPSPPANFTNLKWQSDASGNISAYDPGRAWQTWTPGFSGSASMTVTAGTIPTAQYVIQGAACVFEVVANLTIGGTLSNLVYMTMPVALTGTTCGIPVTFSGAGQNSVAIAAWSSSTTIQIQLLPSSNYVAGTTVIYINSSYRIA